MAGVGATVLAGAGAAMLAWQHQVSRQQEARRMALAWVDPMARVEGCLFGTDGAPASAAELPRQLRRVALGPDAARGWPSRCLDLLAPAGGSAEEAAVARLRAALRSDDAQVASLRRDGVSSELGGWRPQWLALRADVGRRLSSAGVSLRSASMVDAPRPRAVEPGEELPVSLSESATLAGASAGDGVLSMMWVDHSRERIFCRSRDGGGTIRCRRFAAPGPSGGVLALLASDRAEALVLVDQGAGSYGVASADDPWSPLFGLRGVPLQSLPLRARNDVVYAITTRGGRAQFEQVPRAAPGAVAPLGPEVSLERESALVAAGDPSLVWWVTSTATPGGLALDFRALGVQTAWRSPTPLRSPAALLATCHAGPIAYVAVADAGQSRVLAIDAQGPRELGLTEASGRAPRLSCDGAGVTVVGEGSFQSCGLSGGCTPPVRVPGLRALARSGDSLVMVRAVGEHEAPRVLRRPLSAQDTDARDELVVLSDDVRHGGLAARAAWIFSQGTRLLLFMSGDATVVRWSDDQGRSWHPSREANDVPARLESADDLLHDARLRPPPSARPIH
jgi:hypothetical protein